MGPPQGQFENRDMPIEPPLATGRPYPSGIAPLCWTVQRQLSG